MNFCFENIGDNVDSNANNLPDSIQDDDEHQPPSIVIYLVEPFTMGSDNSDLQRLACLALLKCFQSVLSAIPDHIRTNINVQVCTFNGILEF